MITAKLLEDVRKVGQKGMIVSVKDGYFFNFLQPKNLAKLATKNDIENAEEIEKEIKSKSNDKKELFVKVKKAFEEKGNPVFTLSGKAEGEKLFAALHEKDVVNTIEKEFDIKIEEKNVKLADQLKTIGEHNFSIEIDGEKVEGTLEIKAE